MRRLLAIVLAPVLISACGGSPSAPSAPCVATPDNTSINIGFAGGSGVVTVQSTCTWTAVSNNPLLLTITGGANGNGAGTISFTVPENTGTQSRTNTISVTPAGGAAVTISVTQAAPPPPITWTLPAINAAVVGQPYNQNIATATGGIGELHYQLDTFGGFPPIGLILAPNGIISGTASTASVTTFRVCAVDTTQRQFCQPMTITVTAAPATGGGSAAANGSWSGTIVLQVGCTAPLPMNYPWTGTIRGTSSGGSELVVSVPRALVLNEVHAITITGQNLRFTVDFDSLYTFIGTFSSDFRSITGTFSGGNCNVPPTIVLPSGTWNGTKQ